MFQQQGGTMKRTTKQASLHARFRPRKIFCFDDGRSRSCKAYGGYVFSLMAISAAVGTVTGDKSYRNNGRQCLLTILNNNVPTSFRPTQRETLSLGPQTGFLSGSPLHVSHSWSHYSHLAEALTFASEALSKKGLPCCTS